MAINPCVEAFHHISPLSAETKEALEAVVTYRSLARNDELLAIGQVSHYLYFIHKGLARIYYYFRDVDVTTYFAADNQFLGGIDSLFTRRPSNKGIHLLEDSEIYSISYDQFENLCVRFHDLERAGRKLAIHGLLISQQRIESLRFLEAKERYIELTKQYPGLLNRAPLKHIASYLGITQVTLSRIRAQY